MFISSVHFPWWEKYNCFVGEINVDDKTLCLLWVARTGLPIRIQVFTWGIANSCDTGPSNSIKIIDFLEERVELCLKKGASWPLSTDTQIGMAPSKLSHGKFVKLSWLKLLYILLSLRIQSIYLLRSADKNVKPSTTTAADVRQKAVRGSCSRSHSASPRRYGLEGKRERHSRSRSPQSSRYTLRYAA